MILSNCFNDITSGLTNKIYQGCCCSFTCTVTPEKGEECFRITDVQINPNSGEDGNTQVTAVNGNPLPVSPFPFNAPFTFDVILCSSATVQTRRYTFFIAYIDCKGIGQTQQWELDIETIDFSQSWNPSGINNTLPHNFGNVAVGQSATFQAIFTNLQACSIEIQDNISGSNPGEITSDFPGGQVVVLPAQSLTINFTFTPSAAGLYQATHSFLSSKCGNTSLGGIRFSGTGEDTPPPTDCIYCEDVTYHTEDDLIAVQNIGCNFNPANYVGFNAFGEKKSFEFTYNYAAGLANGFKIWFVPEFWADFCDFAAYYPNNFINQPPPVAWFINYNNGITTTTAMTLTGAGAATNSQKNFLAEFVPISGTQFKIRLTFFFGMDLDSWLNSALLNNQDRFLKSSRYETTQLTNNVPSVFNQDRQACFFIYVVDPNNPVTDPNTGVVSDFTCNESVSFKQTASFLNKSLYNAPSIFTNPTFELKRSGNVVTDFSTVQKTTIEFSITVPAGRDVDDVVFQVMEVTGTGNTTTFLENYDSSRSRIQTNTVPGVLDNHLETPSQQPTDQGGNVWKTTATFGTNLDTQGTYKIIAIVYDTDEENAPLVESFISPDFNVTDLPSPSDLCCPPSWISNFNDYNNVYLTDCFTPTVKERFCHNVAIRGGGLIQCLQDLGMPQAADWRQYAETLTLNIMKEVTGYPNANQITSFVFDTYTSYVNPVYGGGWFNPNKGFNVSNVGSEIQTSTCQRVRYEEDQAPSLVYTADQLQPYTRQSVGGQAQAMIQAQNIDYNWANETIVFEYQLKLNLTPLVGSPLFLVSVFRPVIKPFDFEGNSSPNRGLSRITMYDQNGVIINAPICAGSKEIDYILVKTDQIPAAGTLNLIATLDPVPTSVNHLQEEESYQGQANLSQLQSVTLYDVDVVFVNNEAFFKIDISQLGVGTYEICSIALPTNNALPDGNQNEHEQEAQEPKK